MLSVPLSQAHLFVISAITAARKLFLHVQERALRCRDVVRFLPRLLDCLTGLLHVL
jgi:hypothetical protein